MKFILKILAVIFVAPFAPIIAGIILVLVWAFFALWWELVKLIWGDDLWEDLIAFAIIILISLTAGIIDQVRLIKKQSPLFKSSPPP